MRIGRREDADRQKGRCGSAERERRIGRTGEADRQNGRGGSAERERRIGKTEDADQQNGRCGSVEGKMRIGRREEADRQNGSGTNDTVLRFEKSLWLKRCTNHTIWLPFFKVVAKFF